RGVRRDALDAEGDRARARADRQARDERRADPDVRVPRPLLEPRVRGEGVRDRARGRRDLRRHRHPRAARAVAYVPARQRQLVEAELDAHTAVPAEAGAGGSGNRIRLNETPGGVGRRSTPPASIWREHSSSPPAAADIGTMKTFEVLHTGPGEPVRLRATDSGRVLAVISADEARQLRINLGP